eukprot:6201198-Pleurochrysis_carterae.AAC.1
MDREWRGGRPAKSETERKAEWASDQMSERVGGARGREVEGGQGRGGEGWETGTRGREGRKRRRRREDALEEDQEVTSPFYEFDARPGADQSKNALLNREKSYAPLSVRMLMRVSFELRVDEANVRELPLNICRDSQAARFNRIPSTAIAMEAKLQQAPFRRGGRRHSYRTCTQADNLPADLSCGRVAYVLHTIWHNHAWICPCLNIKRSSSFVNC